MTSHDIRPTTYWHQLKRKEAEEFAAGRISENECYMARLFPDEFLDRTELVLNAYATAIARLPSDPASYPAVMTHIKETVLALNTINESGYWIETDERERLCEYIETVLIQHGIDIDALASWHGAGRHELTDEWRDW